MARSESLRDALTLRLEQLSYYEHRSLAGGREQAVCTHRIVDIRGTRFHVLSRIQDAGLDFTNRTNFIAHHLVLPPGELSKLPASSVILQHWDGWKRAWQEEPRLLTGEDWSSLYSLTGQSHMPAQTWARVTGDAVHALGLVDNTGPVFLNTDGLTEQEVLTLFTESLETLEAREGVTDYHAAGWQMTYTTSLQEQDPPADFRWRCVTSDSPIFRKLVGNGQSPMALPTLRATRFTPQEAAFARNGRQPLSVICQPTAVTTQAGDTVTIKAIATGVPAPNRYEWYACARDGKTEQLVSDAGAELNLSDVPIGVKRYAVQVRNARGESAMSAMVTVSAEKKLGLSNSSRSSTPIRVHLPPNTKPTLQQPKEAEPWTADAGEMVKHLAQVEQNRKKRAMMLAIIFILLVFNGSLAFFFKDKIGAWFSNRQQSIGTPSSKPKAETVVTPKIPNPSSPPAPAEPGAPAPVPPQSQVNPDTQQSSEKDKAAFAAMAKEAAAKKAAAAEKKNPNQ